MYETWGLMPIGKVPCWFLEYPNPLDNHAHNITFSKYFAKKLLKVNNSGNNILKR